MDFNVDHPPSSATQDVRRILVAVTIGLLMGLLVVAIVLVSTDDDPRGGSSSSPPASAATTTPPTVWSGAMDAPPPLTQITEAAEVTTTAQRAGQQIQVTEPVPPPFDPVAYVNSLAYCWQCPEPAMEAYRVVATWYGWDAWTIEARATFVQRIMAGESAFCWNARAWSHATALLMPCTQIGQGTRDDVGFGQITNVLRPLTCEKAGICNIAQTIANPWNSMVAYVVVLDELGKRPWCYNNNTHIRNGDCATWPG